MKVLFITALINIHLPGAFGRGIRVSPDMFLANDQAEIGKLLSPRFEALAGGLEVLALKKANGAIYSISDHPEKELQGSNNARIVLIKKMRQVQRFLNCLWLVKDNSANFELGFLEHPFGNKYASTITSNFLAVISSKADGSHAVTEFTPTEVRTARDISLKAFTPHYRDDEGGAYVLPEDFNRVSRVAHFFQVARATSDLGLKVAHYVTCFETLFSTDSAELAHKLSERMALLLGKNAGERTKIYKQVKAAYNIRSKVVHGDKITKRMADQIPELLRNCDEMLRETMMKILTGSELFEIFQRPPDKLEEYFVDMVLGDRNDNTKEDL